MGIDPAATVTKAHKKVAKTRFPNADGHAVGLFAMLATAICLACGGSDHSTSDCTADGTGKSSSREKQLENTIAQLREGSGLTATPRAKPAATGRAAAVLRAQTAHRRDRSYSSHNHEA